MLSTSKKSRGSFFKPSPPQIAAWVTSHFEYKTRKNGSEIVINNPFDGDTGFHFNISTEKGNCHDWRGDHWADGGSNTFLRFVQRYRKCSYIQAVKEVCGDAITLESLRLSMKNRGHGQELEVEKEVILALPPGSQPIIGSSQPKLAQMLISWLRSRGLSEEEIKQHNLNHHCDNVVWPYYEYDALVYWQSRNRLNKVFRFPDESVGVTKGMFLYGFDQIEPGDYVGIVEAIFGVHTLKEQMLASGGAVLTEKQIRKLRALNPAKGVVLAPDNDAAGLRSLSDNYHMISPYFPVFYSIPPRHSYQVDGTTKYVKDWNELGQLVGFGSKVRVIFEKGIKPLNLSDVVHFSSLKT